MRRFIFVLCLGVGCGEKEPVDSGDADGDGYPATEDCDDRDAAVHPGAAERCDGADDDCDGAVDEGARIRVYDDADGDGYGAPESAAEACAAEVGQVEQGGDCNDGDAETNPGEPVEACDDPVDRNCDGVLEFLDEDGDGHAACQDCDDGDADVNPDAEERCDAVDNDCDGEIDEPDALDASTFYADLDGDGYGDAENTTTACFDPPSGYVADDLDCDDDEPSVHPGAEELCDAVDTDCDGAVAEVLVPGDHRSLQSALDAGEPWVCLEAGTYSESVFVRQSGPLRIEGVGADRVTLDGGGLGRTLEIEGGDDALQLSGLTLSGGDGGDSYAGGLRYLGNGVGSVTLSGLVFTGNRCSGATCLGAALNIEDADQVELMDVEVTGNTMTGPGFGSLLIQDAELVTLDGVQVHDELLDATTSSATWGSAVTIYSSATDARTGLPSAAVSINDLEVYDNSATSAGTIYSTVTVYFAGTLDITHSRIAGNSIDAGGFCASGGLFPYYFVSMAMSNVEIIGNSASCTSPTYGAAMLNFGYGDSSVARADISNSVFAGNSIRSTDLAYGGVLTDWNVTATYTNTSIHGNTGISERLYAGWLAYDDAQIGLNNVDFSENSLSTSAGDAYSCGFGSLNGSSSLDVRYSNLFDLGEAYYDPNHFDDPLDGDGVISVDPGYVDVSDPDPLSWDLTLAGSSGLIDAGDPSISDPDGSASDIGAHGGPGAADW
ncbi:MAG: hypothetical protein H6741_00540 [Alphaproteobacteria bacterium]|nr:hypothetical protein [Alphaproteobacteria bacterium]MCB9791192.1 hypothetical protein [Alphaproteobacteria bacterium]